MMENFDKKKEITFCHRCLMPNTRPWGEFKDGLCGACRFDDKKNSEIDWELRNQQLDSILNDSKALGNYDVLVPVSGGKDGSHVAYTLKEKYGCRVLTATLAPPIWTTRGYENLLRFNRFTGIPNVLVTPPYKEYVDINWKGMITMGYPKRGFVAGLVPSMVKVAKAYDIPLIMWGEHEEEYEGERDVHNKNVLITYKDFVASDDFCYEEPNDFLKDIDGDTSMWKFDSTDMEGIDQAHWSRFEKWNSAKHRQTAINKCGLQENIIPSDGTYTMGGQLDDNLYTFFMYMAFVKFGFARVTNDVGIDCRQNGLNRFQALHEIEQYEHVLPMVCYDSAKWYFDKTGPEMWQAIKQWHNEDMLDYTPNDWFRQFKLKPDLIKLRREIAARKGR